MSPEPNPFRVKMKVWTVLACLKLTVLLIAALGCQLKPTKVTETAEIDKSILLKNATGPVRIDGFTVIIDARAPFEYSVAHVPGAVNLQWTDFAQKNEEVPGLVPADLGPLARRLALFGISPVSRVVVVGDGRGGHGEEGRVAWSLLQMGLRDVQTVSVDYFRSGLTNAEPPPRPNAKPWEPDPDAKMVADRREVLAIATAKVAEGQRSTVHLLDVRTRKEYFLKAGIGQGYAYPELRALHIPWEEFFTGDGRPNTEIKNQLLGMGWQPGDRIVVISHKGVRSAAAVFALMSMGFTNSANYAGGYSDLLLAERKGPKLRPTGK
jgi:thiosulfate/3-mercaptopyruvate sulfurtransferase